MTGHACLQSTSYFFPALTLLTFWVTFCVTFHLTNTLNKSTVKYYSSILNISNSSYVISDVSFPFFFEYSRISLKLYLGAFSGIGSVRHP